MIESPPAALDTPHQFEPEMVDRLKNLFEEKIVFNKLLDLKLTAVTATHVSASIAMRPELVGNFSEGRLHGGVISAALDTTGGIAVTAGLCARYADERFEQHALRFSKLGTIDLRIDYLRPGISTHFEIRAQVIRLGARIANTRMEFLGADGKLLATGNGVYIVA
ncbi:MAG: thioesterase family protein [Polaromonas sp.]